LSEPGKISPRTNIAYLILGSNIEPELNILLAANKLRNQFGKVEFSQVWETPPVGVTSSNFLNVGAEIQTGCSLDQLKYKLLRKIEQELGRVRSADKNAPRTIDIDIIIFNDLIVEPDIWHYAHMAVPLAELIPNLLHPKTSTSLYHTAKNFIQIAKLIPRPDINLVGN
jgi:2-amino-4-hydroxy-6-hydroxymethyldihydropteridine diphosphokinase